MHLMVPYCLRKNNYDFCFCGGLHTLTDPLGNYTTYDRDYDGNVTSKGGQSRFLHLSPCNRAGCVPWKLCGGRNLDTATAVPQKPELES